MLSVTDSLSSLEGRARRSIFDDGLFEFLLGTMLLLLGIATAVPDDRLLYPFYFGLIAVFWVLKWRVVLPRAGVVRFASARRQRTVLAVAVLLASTMLTSAVTALLAMGGGAGAWLRAHPVVFDAGFPLLMVIVFSTLAVLLEVARVHAIGVVFALAFGVQMWVGQRIGLLVGGGLVSLAGLVLFVRFLLTHLRLTAGGGGGRRGHVA
jgi:hypothetical protein